MHNLKKRKEKKGKSKNHSPWDDGVVHKSIPIGLVQNNQNFLLQYVN